MSVMIKPECHDIFRITTACLLTACQEEEYYINKDLFMRYINANGAGIIRQ